MGLHDELDEILGVKPPTQIQQGKRRMEQPIPMPSEYRYVQGPQERYYYDHQKATSAMESLTGLPPKGQTWHILMGPDYDHFDHVDAILRYAHPHTIDELRLATLGFSERTAGRLIEMLQDGQVVRATLLVSVFFQAHYKNEDYCGRLQRAIEAFGGWYCTARSHAKVIAAKMTDGRHLVIESSSNLRACRCIEQLTITDDRELYQWWARVMEEINAKTNEAQTAPPESETP